MTLEQAREVSVYCYNRTAGRRALAQLESGLLPQQRAFIDDPAKRKTALCTRRAGKTHAVLCYLVRVSTMRAGAKSVYIGLTRASAKLIVWDELQRMNASHSLGLTFNHSELIAVFPNGSKVLITGADKARDIEKFRGNAFDLVALDECGSFGDHIKQLINEVLSPALMDHNGSLLMLGTPSASCHGVFFDATTLPDSGWSKHSWSVHDNVHVPGAAEWLAAECERRGITEDDPVYQREYCGRWVKSDSSILYRYDAAVNSYTELPRGIDWNWVLGVDLGWHDDTAFVLGCWSAEDPNYYATKMFKRTHLLPDQIGDVIEQLAPRGAKICVDTGGLGKTITEALRVRFGVNVVAAVKTEKMAHIEIMNGDLRAGRVKLLPDAPVLDEWAKLTVTEDGIEDPTQPNHLSDAFLYSWRFARQYLHHEAKPTITPTPDQAMLEHRAKLAERIAERKSQEASFYGSSF